MSTGHYDKIVKIMKDRAASLNAGARTPTPFVLLLPTDPLPENLAEGTVIVRAAATAPPNVPLALSGYIDNTVDANPVSIDISSIPANSWMLAISSTLDATEVVATPAGWTPIISETVAGTLRMFGFAKIKSPDDSLLTLSQGTTMLHATSVLYGVGAASVDQWIVSAVANRSTATSTTTVAPGLTGVPAEALTFAFAAERTNADELTEPTATAPKVTYLHGDATVGIETLYVAQPTVPTDPTTFTYPNAQTSNGLAVTIAVTPYV